MTVYWIVLAAIFVPTAIATGLKGKWWVLAFGLIVAPAWVLGAVRLARPSSYWARRFYGEEQQRRAAEEASRRRRLALIAGLVSLALFGALRVALKTYLIPASSMEPTLKCGTPAIGCSGEANDRLLARRFLPGERPGRGDIVVFETPHLAAERCGAGGTFVKRVIGLPGERVAAASGVVTIDGEPLDEPYVERGPTDAFAAVVPESTYFVLGDARTQSCDSRVWGSVPEDALVAKAVARYWPPSRIGRVD